MQIGKIITIGDNSNDFESFGTSPGFPVPDKYVDRIINEDLGIVITEHKVIACQNGGWCNLDHIKDDLTNSFGSGNYDIVAVRRPKDKCDCCFDAFRYNAPRGTLVYEQKEVEEMTLSEVCKLLGKEIKIVKG